jgi:hypothetical protein
MVVSVRDLLRQKRYRDVKGKLANCAKFFSPDGISASTDKLQLNTKLKAAVCRIIGVGGYFVPSFQCFSSIPPEVAGFADWGEFAECGR